MRPPAPGALPSHARRASGLQRLGPALRMIVRNMERRPLRTGCRSAASRRRVAIVVMGELLSRRHRGRRRQYAVQPRACAATCGVADRAAWTALARCELARLPGVLRSESLRVVPVTSGQSAIARAQRSILRRPAWPASCCASSIVDCGPVTLPHGAGAHPDRPLGRQARPACGRHGARRGAGGPSTRTSTMPVDATVRRDDRG